MRFVVYRGYYPDKNPKREYLCIPQAFYMYWINEKMYATKFDKKELAEDLIRVLEEMESIHKKLGQSVGLFGYAIEECKE